MGQQDGLYIKKFAAKRDDLGSIPNIHTAEERSDPGKVSSDLYLSAGPQ